jgi:lantibiotic biosynthesis protein
VPPGTEWHPVIVDGDRRRKATEIARELGHRLCDSDRLARAIYLTSKQSSFPSPWVPHATADGDVGLALMCGYLDACFPKENWDSKAHRFLERAAVTIGETSTISLGAFNGLAGVAFAALSLSKDGKRYRKFLETVETNLIERVDELCNRVQQVELGLSVEQWDLISGLSGIGAYLLSRAGQPRIGKVLDKLLSSLAELTHLKDGVPRWFMPASSFSQEEMRLEFPDGNLNCGLAHGIPGPLALLSLAWGSGKRVAGIKDAIETIAEWLLVHRVTDEWGTGWPAAVPVITFDGAKRIPTEDEMMRHFPRLLQSCRTAWCYGSPGVARSLWLAGNAVEQKRYRTASLEALEAVFRRPWFARQINSPTFCHGRSGLLQITLRFAREANLHWLDDAATRLLDEIISLYEPDSLLGYRDLDSNGQTVDRPGLLNGTAGIAMVLLATASNVEPRWDRLFLLS